MDQVAEKHPRRLQRLPDFLRERDYWSRSQAYRRAAVHRGLFLKFDRSTLVNLDVADAIEAELPDARVRPGRRSRGTHVAAQH